MASVHIDRLTSRVRVGSAEGWTAEQLDELAELVARRLRRETALEASRAELTSALRESADPEPDGWR